MNISYVYPNVSGIKQRGGLLDRWELAKQHGCELIEVPADLIKNKTEMEKTGLHLGEFLTDKSIRAIYEYDDITNDDIKYVLHTEPSLPRNDGYGLSYQAPIKWYDESWRKRLKEMIISISRFFQLPASFIEIHPGDKRNTNESLCLSIDYLLDNYRNVFDMEPVLLIENRTDQFISNGTKINEFWDYLFDNHRKLKNQVGIVLDLQQLYTVTKKDFLSQLSLIPQEAIRGFHIYCRHRLPHLSDKIPWLEVFDYIKTINQDVIINPEIHHKNKLQDTIDFCKRLLSEITIT